MKQKLFFSPSVCFQHLFLTKVQEIIINTESLFFLFLLSWSKHTTNNVLCSPKFTCIYPKIDELNQQNMIIYEVGLCDIHQRNPSIYLKKGIDSSVLGVCFFSLLK